MPSTTPTSTSCIARRSVVIAILMAFMVQLLLFAYIPILHKTLKLHGVSPSLSSSSSSSLMLHDALIRQAQEKINKKEPQKQPQQKKQHQKRQQQKQQQQQQKQEQHAATPLPAKAKEKVKKKPKRSTRNRSERYNQKKKEREKTMDPRDIDVVEPPFVLSEFINATALQSTVYSGPLTLPNRTDQLNKTKIVGFITQSYVRVALRWYDRLSALGYSNHYIICVDTGTYEEVLKEHSKNKMYRIELSLLPPFPEELATLRYGKKMRHLVKMLFAHRWVYILQQLHHGHHVLVTDVDNIFSSYLDTRDLELSQYDIYHALETKHPEDVYQSQGFVFCGGMGWFRSSPPAITVLQEMVQRCGIECDDQVLLNRIVAYILNVQWDGVNANETTIHNQDSKEVHKAFGSNHFDRIVGLVTKGFTGYSNATGAQIKVWDRNVAYRGKNNPTECPPNNWVSMPLVVFTARWEAPASKYKSYDIWDKTCPNDYTRQLMDGKGSSDQEDAGEAKQKNGDEELTVVDTDTTEEQ